MIAVGYGFSTNISFAARYLASNVTGTCLINFSCDSSFYKGRLESAWLIACNQIVFLFGDQPDQSMSEGKQKFSRVIS